MRRCIALLQMGVTAHLSITGKTGGLLHHLFTLTPLTYSIK
jgi:hypothetical protein